MSVRAIIAAATLAACGTSPGPGGVGGGETSAGGGTHAGGGIGGGGGTAGSGGGGGGAGVDAGPAPRATFFAYDSMGHLIGEYDETGAAVLEIVHFEGAPVAVIASRGTDETVFAVHTDHLGTPRALEDATGKLAWTWESDAFGGGAPNQDPLDGGTRQRFPMRFAGQYFDDESGLHYNGMRDYDPTVGRYLQPDPLGLMSGQTNLYAYANNSPLAFTDPTGELGLGLGAAIAAIGIIVYVGITGSNSASTAESAIAGIPGPIGGPADAIRHCTWNCEMYRWMGSGAGAPGYLWEVWGYYHGQQVEDWVMDLHNNAVGRRVGALRCPQKPCVDRCKDALRSGKLWYLP